MDFLPCPVNGFKVKDPATAGSYPILLTDQGFPFALPYSRDRLLALHSQWV